MNTISVIVPTLNEEKLLERMLRQFTPSLVDRFGIELVVSDGGSVDRTLEIAAGHASERAQMAIGAEVGAGDARASGSCALQGGHSPEAGKPAKPFVVPTGS